MANEPIRLRSEQAIGDLRLVALRAGRPDA
jgi:hypothetical protein